MRSIVSIDKFEKKKEIKKIRTIKNTWYECLINYIPELTRKSVAGFKDKIVSLFKTNTPKQTVNGRAKKPLEKTLNIRDPFILKRNKLKIIRDIWTLFETKEAKKRKKEIRKKKLIQIN